MLNWERPSNNKPCSARAYQLNSLVIAAGGDQAAIALKAVLYSALRARKMTVADLARRLDIDERKAARLIDPRATGRLIDLETALSALGYAIAIEVHEKPAA